MASLPGAHWVCFRGIRVCEWLILKDSLEFPIPRDTSLAAFSLIREEVGMQFRSLSSGVTLIFTGPPGCGKGTYGKTLGSRWGFQHVSLGDIIRAELANSPLDVNAKSLADRGLLIPDHVVFDLCKQYIRSHAAQKSWILDGFPRTLRQAQMLREFARPHACVNFHLPKNILVRKLLGRRICNLCGGNFNTADIHETPYQMPAILPSQDCTICKGDAPLSKRADDSPEIIQKRLDTYETATKLILDEYEAEGILVNFDPVKGMEDITRLESTIISFIQNKYGNGSL